MRPNAKEPTAAELKELQHLKAVLEQATSDGIVTQNEIEVINDLVINHAAGHTSEQIFREMELYRSLLTQKVQNGELQLEAFISWTISVG